MDWNLFFQAAGVLLVFVGMIAGGGALFVRMTIHNQLARFMERLEEKFVTENDVRAIVTDELKPIWLVVERRKAARTTEKPVA